MDADDTELVEDATEEKNWKGIGLAALAITIIIGLVVTAIVLVTPGGEEKIELTRLTLEDFLTKKYAPREIAPNWIKGEEAFTYRDQNGSVTEFDCKSNTSTLLIPSSVFKSLNTSVYKVSPDRKYALLAVGTPEKVNTFSTLSRYSLYDIIQGTTENFQGHGGNDVVQFIGWSSTGHDIVFIQGNNLFHYNFDAGRNRQLTFDGINGQIFNAVPDWLYEEEIIKDDKALWLSDDGRSIIFAQFNDTSVRKYSYPVYGNVNKKYAEIRTIAYPKPGTSIPTFVLKIANLNTGSIVDVIPPSELLTSPGGYYFTSVSWINTNSFLVTWLNRFQNETLFTVCATGSGSCNVIYKEEGHGTWVDTAKPRVISPDGHSLYTVISTPEGQAGYYKHVMLVNLNQHRNSGVSKFLTHGEFEVTDIVGINEDLTELYYIATPADPRKRHLYSLNIGSVSTNPQPITKCLSCDIDANCQYVTASFSGSGKYYIIGCLGPDIPRYIVKSTQSNTTHVLEDNGFLVDVLKKTALPIQHYIDIPINDDQVMHSKLLLPSVFNEEEITRYPLVLVVTGEPGSQSVLDKFDMSWTKFLSSSKNYIIAFVDGRGSGGRGDNYAHSVYKHLGGLEVQDLIAAASYFETLPYVDTTKLAIFGMSHGGYLTTQVLGTQPEWLFECGVSVSPITNWLYYDAVYTERYMSTPDINPVGYSTSSAFRNVGNFKNAMFMLIHGMTDDNVHFRHSAELIQALHNEGVHFKQQAYVDVPRDINRFSRHLFVSIERFLQQCFYGTSGNS